MLYLLVALANYWIWRIAKSNLLLGLVLISLSLALAYLSKKFNLKIFLFFLGLIAVITYHILILGFDQGLRNITLEGEKRLGERHGYFAINLGPIFQNKFTLRFYKDISPYLNVYQSNVFNSLSPNLYFFANHPREREKIHEFNMYFSLFIIPFLVGLVIFLNKSNLLILGYFVFALLTTGLIRQDYIFGPILLFPLINYFIVTGLIKIFKFFKK